LNAIRQLLAGKPVPAAAPRAATTPSLPFDSVVEIQPSAMIANPGDLTIQFREINGLALSKLGERFSFLVYPKKRPCVWIERPTLPAPPTRSDLAQRRQYALAPE